eukprot:1137309-Pelagomonas_calceolata.AAC.1
MVGVGNSNTIGLNTFYTVRERAVDTCSNFLFTIMNMTTPPVYAYVLQSGTLTMRIGLDWLEGSPWHSLNPGMPACIELRVEWLPTLCSFQLPSGTALSASRSQALCAEKEVFPGWSRIVDRCSKGWYEL